MFSQASMAFHQVLGSVSFMVDNVGTLAGFAAGVDRLLAFQAFVEEGDGEPSLGRDARGPTPPQPAAADNLEAEILLRCTDLAVGLPSGKEVLLDGLQLSVTAATRLLVTGPSGCGKTSFLRTLCGLWAPAAGHVSLASGVRLMFLPQRPYMILGTMRQQLCYPGSPEGVSEQQLLDVLQTVGLATLAEEKDVLDRGQDWGRTLSLGEQQRVAFGRLLLASPKVAVLDEATSALDEAAEDHLYSQLTCTALISVGHRSSLRKFHRQALSLEDRKWTLSTL